MEISTINFFDQVTLLDNQEVGAESWSNPMDVSEARGAEAIIGVLFGHPGCHSVNFEVWGSSDGITYSNSPRIQFGLPYSNTGASLHIFVNGLAYFKFRCFNTTPADHNRVSIQARPWRYCDEGFMSAPLVRD